MLLCYQLAYVCSDNIENVNYKWDTADSISRDSYYYHSLYSGGTPEHDWSYDPSEPRYCICNQVSYGDMVACDNEDVSIFLKFLTAMAVIIDGMVTYRVYKNRP